MLGILGTTRSVISGSAVLKVLTNLQFIPNDLDVYVPEAQEGAMDRFLTTEMGFTCYQKTPVQYPEHVGLKIHYSYCKGAHKIDVLVVEGDNALLALFRFHSTIVMNFISHKGVYCAYPDLTMNHLSVANTEYLADPMTAARTNRCLEKYRRRGVQTETQVGIGHKSRKGYRTHECGVDPNCSTTLRSVHDGHGTFTPMGSYGEENKKEEEEFDAYDNCHSVVWSIGGPVCRTTGGTTHKMFATSVELC
ncbi:hypothetical protein B0H11DRAFT_1700047 [Mycena galericulata]|nr:hypothetical protein B0H11DRAFT_1700047 [Mycena galericulata]